MLQAVSATDTYSVDAVTMPADIEASAKAHRISKLQVQHVR
jgi:hypothetical protein